jgi:predicted nucleic-acid-binding protein
MIGIDTRLLLRLWCNDAAVQNKRIDALLAEHGGPRSALRVTNVVVAGAAWTLKSAFDQAKNAPLSAVSSLLEQTAFAFEDREAVARAVTLLDLGSCGFSGRLVVAQQARPAATSPRPATKACANGQG